MLTMKENASIVIAFTNLDALTVLSKAKFIFYCALDKFDFYRSKRPVSIYIPLFS